MKPLIAFFAVVCLFSAGVSAADKAGAKAEPVTMTFFVAGIECAACVEVVRQSVAEVKGVTNVAMEQRLDSVANVTFDPAEASAHQIAQAVTDAVQLHGQPYQAWMQLRIPDYAKPGNAARVDAVLARMKPWVDVVLVDKATGEFMVHFEPLKADETQSGPRGWSPEQLGRELQRPLPEGPGLVCSWVMEPI
jgi:copper chaperone CopZ